MNPPIIECDNVSFSYNEIPILRDISFKILQNEFIGLIGPNGGGKTTLLKLIMGFLTPTKGTLKVFGVNPQDLTSQIAYVPQTIAFDKQFPLSVLELVLMGRLSKLPWYGRFKEEDKNAAREALDKVGILHLENRAFGSLSTGQSQRALIARALVSNPKLLLLDEPTASVDAESEAKIYSILHELKNHVTLLMVTHDLRAIVNEVQRVLCIQTNLKALKPEEVCEHFAYGLYHPPLIKTEENAQ